MGTGRERQGGEREGEEEECSGKRKGHGRTYRCVFVGEEVAYASVAVFVIASAVADAGVPASSSAYCTCVAGMH